jgi:hypothetical protein
MWEQVVHHIKHWNGEEARGVYHLNCEKSSPVGRPKDGHRIECAASGRAPFNP